jgi:DNA mismatch repair protein MutL
LVVDGRVHFRSSGSGNLELALAEAQGDDLRHRLVALGPVELAEARVTGLVSVGGLTRPSRQHLAIFVNRRRVRIAALDAALEAGYAGLLPSGRHPVGAVFVTAPPASVDVNVHPSKEQVRLRAETELARVLTESVRACLQAVPREPEELEPFVMGSPSVKARNVAESGGLWESEPARTIPRYLAQLHSALLLCETRHGLVLVDQHRAHERVVYERLTHASANWPTQALLEPAVVESTPSRTTLIEARLTELHALGFEYERFGDHAFRLRSAPVLPDGYELLAFASEALNLAGEQDEFWRDRLLATVACRSAVKKGRPLPALQAAALIEELFQAREPTICPHGSPSVLQLSRPFLRRQFRW